MNNKTCGECCHLEKTESFSFKCKHCNDTVSSSNTACNHFSKQYGICPECGSYLFSYEHTENNDWQLCTCDRCGCSGTPQEFLYNSVFARITASPDVLVESLVFWEGGWTSRFINFTTTNKDEAIAATLAELKEVKE